MALHGIRIIELAGLAPAPFAGLILSDLGADVVRVDRPPSYASTAPSSDQLTRGKRSIALDLQSKKDRATFLSLISNADVLIEGYRPGVMERLKLGPDECHATNPNLIYARLTGFPRTGDYSSMAGHDINYLAISGLLSLLGTKESPIPPGNILGDFAGGGMVCVLGILTALLARSKEQRIVVENNMVDGAAYLGTFPRLARTELQAGIWGEARGDNWLDGGCPYYACYRTLDGKFMAVGALELHFYDTFIRLLLGSNAGLAKNRDREHWKTLRSLFLDTFGKKTQAQWCAVFNNTDACVTPIIESVKDIKRPFTTNIDSKSQADDDGPIPGGRDTEQVLADWLQRSSKL